jgi:sialate O-acetylesterase
MSHRFGLPLAGLLWLALVGPAPAEVKLHGLFTNHMVLQQGVKIPVWGTAAPSEAITVKVTGNNFGEQMTTTADAQGQWRVELSEMTAARGPLEITVAGTNTITLKDVLIGEVWICSGQSNMEWPLRASANATEAIAAANRPQIRLYTVPKKVAQEPLTNVSSRWVVCSPETVPGFSAVAYHFGRHLQAARNVPIGLIHTSWGGTPAEAWTRTDFFANSDLLKDIPARHAQAVAEFAKNKDRLKREYEEALARHKELAAKAKEEGKRAPTAPRPPMDPAASPHGASVLFNGMIAPLLPFPIKGAIWYQGESNAGRAYAYRTLFPEMIKSWRASWHLGDFPFLCVQLAPWREIKKEPMESDWAELREAQFLTTKVLPNVGMAVITDVGDEKDIHPRQKEPVGQRLALLARKIAYGEPIVANGPTLQAVTFEMGKAYVKFTHVGGGLVCKGDKLTGFTICGADKKFHNAEATIQDDMVVVHCPEVPEPIAVRFGWANYPVVNLWNKEGLPAVPFRTDDFPGVTWPKK